MCDATISDRFRTFSPSDVLNKIFAYLDWTSIKHCAKVCETWRRYLVCEYNGNAVFRSHVDRISLSDGWRSESFREAVKIAQIDQGRHLLKADDKSIVLATLPEAISIFSSESFILLDQYKLQKIFNHPTFKGDLQFVDVAFSKTYLVVLVQEGSGHAQLKDFVTEFIILIPRDRDSNHPRRTLGLGTTSPHSIKIFGDNIYARSGSSLKIFRNFDNAPERECAPLQFCERSVSTVSDFDEDNFVVGCNQHNVVVRIDLAGGQETWRSRQLDCEIGQLKNIQLLKSRRTVAAILYKREPLLDNLRVHYLSLDDGSLVKTCNVTYDIGPGNISLPLKSEDFESMVSQNGKIIFLCLDSNNFKHQEIAVYPDTMLMEKEKTSKWEIHSRIKTIYTPIEVMLDDSQFLVIGDPSRIRVLDLATLTPPNSRPSDSVPPLPPSMRLKSGKVTLEHKRLGDVTLSADRKGLIGVASEFNSEIVADQLIFVKIQDLAEDFFAALHRPNDTILEENDDTERPSEAAARATTALDALNLLRL